MTSSTKAKDNLKPVMKIKNIPVYALPDGEEVDSFLEELRNTPGVCYVLGEAQVVQNIPEEKSKIVRRSVSYEPALFKVVNNAVGNAITRIEKTSVGLATVNEVAYFTLPKIPYSLIDKIDEFFREVWRVKRTESVVVFVYDAKFKDSDNPSDGWSILVPDQTNTAGSCHYEPQSLAGEYPSTAFIVGSAHSHPEMSAYCSHTDRGDQEYFDGIHITYGWRKGSNHTDYHIEFQMAGGIWSYDEKHIFGDPEEKVSDDKEIAAWVEKVQKPVSKTVVGNYTEDWSSSYASYTAAEKFVLPKGCPSPRDATVILKTQLTKEEMQDCPVCDNALTDVQKEKSRCNSCYLILQFAGMSYEDVVAARDTDYAQAGKNVDPAQNPYRDIWLWDEAPDGKKTKDEVTRIYKYEPQSHVKSFTQGGTNSVQGGGSGKADGGLSSAVGRSVTCVYCKTTSELDSSGECFYCGTDLKPFININANKDIKCTTCGQLNAPQEVTCFGCDQPLSTAGNLDDIFGEYDDEEGMGVFGAAYNTLMSNNSLWMACCNKDVEDAQCTETYYTNPEPTEVCPEGSIPPVTLQDLEEIVQNEVYDVNGGCDNCIFIRTPQCPQYVETIREFLFHDDVETLSRCDNYETLMDISTSRSPRVLGTEETS